ncbi:hypothetical protein [Streptomyces chartreusis]|uniref:hypothetical protein n=1 Tax=Streptomyces chartreusis TaxID=1969 RepID=UPI00381C4C7B|nr:hypothetical protein OG938_28170 [Streptomyces chartreusis]WTA27475.1 hypothetical protein OIA45_16260 [Streptomyces chartreusis]
MYQLLGTPSRVSVSCGLEADLVSLAMDWVRPRPEFTDHFAIVARINAEGENFPGDLHPRLRPGGPRRTRSPYRGQAGCRGRGPRR